MYWSLLVPHINQYTFAVNVKSYMNTKKLILLSVLFGLFFGVAMMYIAWDHNSQCEVHCAGVIHWGYWLQIGGSWFVIGSLSLAVLVGALSWLSAAFKERRSCGS